MSTPTVVHAFLAVVAAGDVEKAREQLNKTVSRIDKVASKNTIHKNAAARKRSRLTKRLNALATGKVTGAQAAAGKTAK